ncbi:MULTISPECIES: G5 domain-containing protein [unclassified Microbacterium]|uniref:G5 domain-containing protein n=1 Tax=unclassified Microbacterium TaxID=2609290 RepID=UPI0009E60F61|nr:G5 domain-containing protein [Microbacterium sp. CGR1]
MSQPPAAWHPDPENPHQLRWWDGHRWTASTAPSPAAVATTQIASATAPASAPAPAPAKRKTGWRTAGIIVAALVVGGVLARLSPIAILLVATAVVGIALYVMIARPLPALGLRSRMSGVIALGLAALLVTGGGIASASSGTAPTASEPQTFAAVTTSAPTPTPTPTPTTFETATEEVPVPFTATTVDDPQLDQGATALVAAGVNGVKVITYRLTLIDGVEVSREVVSEAISVQPVNEVTAIGSKAPAPVAAPAPAPAPVPLVQQGGGGCDSNYTGACVPISSDVDCAGGSGDGPGYVQGPVQVVGSDIYDLDRDGDGIACD